MALANTWFDTTRKGAAVTVADDASSGAAPTRVQSAASAVSSGSSITATLAAPPTAGNLLVAVLIGALVGGTSPPWNAQAGWATEMNDYGQVVNYQGAAIYTRRVLAGDSASVTLSLAGGSGIANLHVFEYSGASGVGTYVAAPSVSGLTMTSNTADASAVAQVLFHMPNNSATPVYSSASAGTLLHATSGGNRPAVSLDVTGLSTAVTTTWGAGAGGNLSGFCYSAGFLVYNTSVRRQALAKVLTAATTGSAPVQTPLSDKHYAEFVIGATLTGSARVGLCNNGFTTTGLLGVDANGIGYDAGGTVKLGNVTVATLTAFGIGDNIGMAVNRRLGLVWFRKNGGNWNNDVLANQDPENNIGGITLASITGNLYPAWGGSAVSTVDGRFKSAEWAYSAPTGYAQVNADPLAERKSMGRKYQAFAAVGAWNGPRNRTPVLKDPVWPLYSLIAPLGPSVLITGVVQESGVPVADRQVFVFDRTSGALLGKAVSDAVGAFSIICRGRGKVMVVARGTTTYNAKIFDSVVPV